MGGRLLEQAWLLEQGRGAAARIGEQIHYCLGSAHNSGARESMCTFLGASGICGWTRGRRMS